MIKRITILAAAMLMFWAAPSAAQYSPPFTGEVDDTTVEAGDTITVSGECPDADEVIASFDGEVIATIPVGDDDSYSGPVTIPADTAPGTYTLSLDCGGEVLDITITVDGDDGGPGQEPGPGGDGPGQQPGPGGDDTGSDAGPLARTGAPVDSLVMLAGALLVLGAATVLLTTKRRRLSAD